jgi:hypothetical protein
MPRDGTAWPALSSEEMTIILERCGARVVARTDHGLLFAAHRHLFLLREAPAVADEDLGDIVRCARISAARLGELLAELRLAKKPGGMRAGA